MKGKSRYNHINNSSNDNSNNSSNNSSNKFLIGGVKDEH